MPNKAAPWLYLLLCGSCATPVVAPAAAPPSAHQPAPPPPAAVVRPAPAPSPIDFTAVRAEAQLGALSGRLGMAVDFQTHQLLVVGDPDGAGPVVLLDALATTPSAHSSYALVKEDRLLVGLVRPSDVPCSGIRPRCDVNPMAPECAHAAKKQDLVKPAPIIVLRIARFEGAIDLVDAGMAPPPRCQ